jgi:YVTN family beta-propeller protein
MLSARVALLVVLSILPSSALVAQSSFVNWETPHVHPLDLTPDGSTLLAVNTADARLEVFDVTGPVPTPVGSVPVGLDPVSVRARGNGEAWVVNHVSDSVSIVDLVTLRVSATLATEDEPADVVFAGSPERAFVSCSQANSVLVFEIADLSLAPTVLDLDVEDPRALAVSADGASVYAAVFESGNGSTALGGGSTMAGGFPPNVVNVGAGPYAGVNPPPNVGPGFSPPIDGALPTPPRVSMIVKKDGSGNWMDDNGGDWSSLVSGFLASQSGRPVGWDLPDRDVVEIDVATLAVSFHTRLMNICMAMAVNPATGVIGVVGTDGTNEVRFEPNLTGVFLRVNLALVDPAGPSTSVVDLNDHLDYTTATLLVSERELGLGDPRGIAFEDDGSRAWITGMGSDNVIMVDAAGGRTGLVPTIEVGQGPTGVVVHDRGNRVYVLNKFDASISVIDMGSESETARVPFHDATPAFVNTGRRHLYGTHETSGTGIVACGSCHVDSRMDRLAWDLGDPQGSMKPLTDINQAADIPVLNDGFEPFHPMKGPMTTQTLQDIIGHEPLHWRGDRLGLEEFNPAFIGLQGNDTALTPTQMQEFEDFLATITFPPNPFRNFDNSLPTNLPLEGHLTPGHYGAAGLPMPDGDAVNGLALYRPPNLFDLNAVACVTCHTLPVGTGPDMTAVGFIFQPLPPGPNGERHHALVSMDGATNISIKIPHLRNLYEKTGMDLHSTESRAGFGFVRDGTVDTIERFLTEPVFTVPSLQNLADLTAFMLAFSGSDLPQGSVNLLALEPPGTASKDSHAGVGRQTTVQDGGAPAPGQATLIADMLAMADAGDVDVVVKGNQGGLGRGWHYTGSGSFQSDRAAETVAAGALLASAAPGSELTYTVVPVGTGTRYGVDRDEDSHLDRDELDAGSDPADPDSTPGNIPVHVAAVDVTHEVQMVSVGGGPGPQAFAMRQRAMATVTVHDGGGLPVQDALVSAHWSGTVEDVVSGTTDAAGQLALVTDWVPLRGTCFTLTVDGLSGDDLFHDTPADVVSSGASGSACP